LVRIYAKLLNDVYGAIIYRGNDQLEARGMIRWISFSLPQRKWRRMVLVEAAMKFQGGFLFLTVTLASCLAAAQTAPPQTPQVAQPRSAESPSPGQAPADQTPAAAPEKTWRKFEIVTAPPKGPALKQLPDAPLDPGIYLQRTAILDSVCGTIVSYNFSKGINPRLEGVTSCTPIKTIRTLKVDDRDKQVQSTEHP
jgi:hypothetical protein